MSDNSFRFVVVRFEVLKIDMYELHCRIGIRWKINTSLSLCKTMLSILFEIFYSVKKSLETQ